jgi:hypothetical protein
MTIDVHDIAADAVFSTFGIPDSTYTPSGGVMQTGITVRVETAQREWPSQFQARVSAAAVVLSFLVSEVPLPARDATVVVGGETYKITSAPLDGTNSAKVKVAAVHV